MRVYNPNNRQRILFQKLDPFLKDDGKKIYLSSSAPEGYDKLFVEWQELVKKEIEEDDGLDW